MACSWRLTVATRASVTRSDGITQAEFPISDAFCISHFYVFFLIFLRRRSHLAYNTLESVVPRKLDISGLQTSSNSTPGNRCVSPYLATTETSVFYLVELVSGQSIYI